MWPRPLARRRRYSLAPPPILHDNPNVQLYVDADDFTGWVTLLGDPVRAKRAYWHLVLSGELALPAVRDGLRHENADVRMYSAKALDHLVDEESFPDLVSMLEDPDQRVRWD